MRLLFFKTVPGTSITGRYAEYLQHCEHKEVTFWGTCYGCASLTRLPLFRRVFKVPRLGSGLCLWVDFSDCYTPGITGHNNKRIHHRAGGWSRHHYQKQNIGLEAQFLVTHHKWEGAGQSLLPPYIWASCPPPPRNTTANLAVRSVSAYFVTMLAQPFLVTQKEPSHTPQWTLIRQRDTRGKYYSLSVYSDAIEDTAIQSLRLVSWCLYVLQRRINRSTRHFCNYAQRSMLPVFVCFVLFYDRQMWLLLSCPLTPNIRAVIFVVRLFPSTMLTTPRRTVN